MTDDRSVNWLRCQLRVACPALNSFSSYVVNNFEELNDMSLSSSKLLTTYEEKLFKT